jgi:hypothetical protein
VENSSLHTEGIMRNSEEGICPGCSKEEDWNRILRCGRTKIGETRIWTKSAEIGTKRLVRCKNKENNIKWEYI